MKHTFYLLIILFGFLACSDENMQEEENRVFRYNESKGLSTLDPAYARNQTIIWPVTQIFNGLVQMDQNMNVKACIAEHWEISSDGKQYTFYLRDDVYFHDHELFMNPEERKVSASDVLYSFNRILDPEIASPGFWIFSMLNEQRPFEVINDTVFRIHLSEPFPPFMGILSMPYCSVVSEEIAEYFGKDFARHPVGTGPFYLKIWREDEKLVLLRNNEYFEKDSAGHQLPYLDAVAITFIKDKQSEFLEFLTGKLDFLSGVHPVYKDELLTRGGRLNPKYENRFKMLSQPYLNTEYLGFLVDSSSEAYQNSPLTDVRIRQAINYGFNRKKMMKYLRNNLGVAANHGFVPLGLPLFDPAKIDGYYYNPDTARILLEEAGYPLGEGLEEIKLTTTSDYLDLCEFIQFELSKLGIQLDIEVATGGSFRNKVANSNLLFFRGSWIADYPDAENYLSLFYSQNFSPQGPNYTHFSNAEFDALYVQASETIDDSLRAGLYHRMDQIVIDQAPVVPLYYDEVIRFVPLNITGLGINPMNLLVLKSVNKEQYRGE